MAKSEKSVHAKLIGEKALKIKLTKKMPLDPKFRMRALELAGEEIWDLMTRIVPVDTGMLRGSIEIFPIAQDVIGIGPNRFYERYVEFGTRRQRAQPYVRPAFDERKSKAIRTMKDSIRLYLKKQAKK